MTPQIGEIWQRKKALNDELKEVRVIAVDNRYIHIEDKNGVFHVFKEVWDEYFSKKEETNQA